MTATLSTENLNLLQKDFKRTFSLVTVPLRRLNIKRRLHTFPDPFAEYAFYKIPDCPVGKSFRGGDDFKAEEGCGHEHCLACAALKLAQLDGPSIFYANSVNNCNRLAALSERLRVDGGAHATAYSNPCGALHNASVLRCLRSEKKLPQDVFIIPRHK